MIELGNMYDYLKEMEKLDRERMIREYPSFYERGYRFYTNKAAKDKEECIRSLKERGLDVLIGEVAFDMCGKIISPTYVSIFIKDKLNI